MVAPQAFRFRGFNLDLWQTILCFISFLFLLLLVFRFHGYRLTQHPHKEELTEDC